MTNSIIHQYLEPVIEKLVENMENLYLQTFSNQDIEISKFFHSINEITNELARDATTVLLERKDYDLCKNGQLQREGYTLKDYRSRTLTTTYGAVTFMRSYWLDSETKESFIPLDTLFLIPKRKRFDVGIRSDLAQKATMLGSYNKVAQECDFGISPTSIRNFVLEIHDELESREIDFVEKTENCPKTIYVEADEDHIKVRGGKSKFLKLVYVHEGYEEDSSGRRKLRNPWFIAGLYPGRANERLWQKVSNYITTRYGNDVTVIYSSDGGRWLQAGLDWLPNCTQVLDLFHAAQACSKITKGVDNLEWTEDKNPALLCALHGDLTGFQAIVDQSLSREDISDKQKKMIKEQALYIEEHFENLKPYDLGVTPGDSTEGHVSHCLSARCSSRPMTWSQKGIDALIMVRMMCYNGVDILDFRRKELVNTRKKLRNDRLIKLDRRKLKKYKSQNTKYHEALQVKVSTDNPRLQTLIHNI